MIPANSFYLPVKPSATSVLSVSEFWASISTGPIQPAELPDKRLAARLSTYERATAHFLHIDFDSDPPANCVGEALVRLRGWHRDRGLHFYSINRLARHLQQSMATPRHPAGWRLAHYGWALLGALDAADLAGVELTAEDSREPVRLATRLAELEGCAT